MFTKIGKSKFMKIVLYITTFAFVGSGVVALLLYKLMGGINGLAEVNGQPISVAEVLFRANQMKLQLENQGINVEDKRLHKNLILTALNQAINDELIYQEAQKEGIEATKEETAKFIKSIDVFKKDGKFSKEMYLNFLAQFNISPQLFEELVRKQLSVQHILTINNLGFYITEEEINALVSNKQARIYGKLIILEPKNIFISEKEIKEFYEKNKKAFATGMTKKITIYKIDISSLGEDKAKEIAKKVYTALKSGKSVNNPAVQIIYQGALEKVSNIPEKLKNEIKNIDEKKNIIFSKEKNAYYITKYEGIDYIVSPFNEVKEAIKNKLTEIKSSEWAKKNFERIKKEFEKSSLEELAKKYQVEIIDLKGDSIPKLTSDLALTPEESDNFLKENKGIFLARDKIVAFRITKRVLYKKEAGMITKMFAPMIEEAKKQSILNMYIQHLRDEADIKINKELLERL
jgi:peptidyl-prolyl cis-trans isomerase D